jgi:hypothetical protein
MAGDESIKPKANNHPPHEAKWFDDFTTNTPDPEAVKVRDAITKMRKQLFVDHKLDPMKWDTIIRIEPKAGHGQGEHPKNDSCGCGCS